MFSQIGRLTAEKFGYQRQNEFDIFELKKLSKRVRKSQLCHFQEQREREKERKRERESHDINLSKSKLLDNTIEDSTHILPFQAYQCRQNMRRADLNTQVNMFIDYPKRKSLGVDLD
ncbi:hypothetical protein pb186bvf_017793 [Paramecium bursaria]